MTTPLLELEGTWEEIEAQLPDFAGQRLHIVVYPAVKNATSTSSPRPIDEMLDEIAASMPAEELAKLPPDFTDHHFTQEGFTILIKRG